MLKTIINTCTLLFKKVKYDFVHIAIVFDMSLTN